MLNLLGLGRVMLSPDADAGGGAAPSTEETTAAVTAPEPEAAQPAAKTGAQTQAQLDQAAQQYLAKIGVDPSALDETGLKAFTAVFTDRGAAIKDGNAKESALKTERRAREAAEAKLTEINSAKFLEGEATPEKLQALFEQSQQSQKGLTTLKGRLGMLTDAGLVPAEVAEFLEAGADADPVQMALKVEAIRKRSGPVEVTREQALAVLAQTDGLRADAAPVGGKAPSKSDEADALIKRHLGINDPQSQAANQYLDQFRRK